MVGISDILLKLHMVFILPYVFSTTSLCVNMLTVRAKMNTELILERAGPVIFRTFFTGFNGFQTDLSILSCKKSKA